MEKKIKTLTGGTLYRDGSHVRIGEDELLREDFVTSGMSDKVIWQILCPDCGAVMAENGNFRELIEKEYTCDGPHDEPLKFVGRQQDLMRKAGTYTEKKKIYHKLIRDKIPEIMAEKNVEFQVKVIESNKEFKQLLYKKLREEVEEFIESPSLGEYADILEVLDALREFHNFKLDDIKDAKILKRTISGGFKKRILLEWTKEK